MTRVALAGGFAFLVSVVLTMVVKRFALRIGAVATPKADRWHRTRIPLLGGVAIAGAVVGRCRRGADPRSGHAPAAGRRADPARGRGHRRRPAAQAAIEARRPDRRRRGARRARFAAAPDRLPAARHRPDAGLDRRDHQRHQPARQHGRAGRRHRGASPPGSAWRSTLRTATRKGRRSPPSSSARSSASSSTTSTRPRSSWATPAASSSASSSAASAWSEAGPTRAAWSRCCSSRSSCCSCRSSTPRS